jgi:hypothetical protein
VLPQTLRLPETAFEVTEPKEAVIFCPWCRRDDLPLHFLKRHIKHCPSSPRPRGRETAEGFMTISNWKSFTKNTLRGFFTITLSSGITIHHCSLHEKNGQRWIGLPFEKYTKKDGTIGYTQLVEFTSRAVADSFRKQVLLALDAVAGCRKS